MKNPLTPAGIEPATFRFVAQHLNYCATAVPLYIYIYNCMCVCNLTPIHDVAKFVALVVGGECQSVGVAQVTQSLLRWKV